MKGDEEQRAREFPLSVGHYGSHTGNYRLGDHHIKTEPVFPPVTIGPENWIKLQERIALLEKIRAGAEKVRWGLEGSDASHVICGLDDLLDEYKKKFGGDK